MLRGSTSAISCSSASAACVVVVQLLGEDLPRAAAPGRRPGRAPPPAASAAPGSGPAWSSRTRRWRCAPASPASRDRSAADPTAASHDLRARAQIPHLPLDQAGELPQVLGLLRRIGDDALDLQVEDARQILEAVQRRVDVDQRGQRLAVVGIQPDNLLAAGPPRPPGPAAGRAGCPPCGGGSGASRPGSRRGGCAAPAPPPARPACPARSRIRSSRVSVSRSPGTGLQDLVRRPLALGEVAGPLVADHQHPTQQPDPLLLGRSRGRSARAAAAPG